MAGESIDMKQIRVLMLLTGIAACLTAHAMYWWHYFRLGEWWRVNIP